MEDGKCRWSVHHDDDAEMDGLTPIDAAIGASSGVNMMSAEAGSRKQPTNSKKTLMVSSTIQGSSVHAGDEVRGLLSDTADR
jgi:hypothetical protein